MTPEQTALLSIAAIEHYGETVTLPNCAKLSVTYTPEQPGGNDSSNR